MQAYNIDAPMSFYERQVEKKGSGVYIVRTGFRFRVICIVSFAYTNQNFSYLIHHAEVVVVEVFKKYRTPFFFPNDGTKCLKKCGKDGFLEV